MVVVEADDRAGIPQVLPSPVFDVAEEVVRSAVCAVVSGRSTRNASQGKWHAFTTDDRHSVRGGHGVSPTVSYGATRTVRKRERVYIVKVVGKKRHGISDHRFRDI